MLTGRPGRILLSCQTYVSTVRFIEDQNPVAFNPHLDPRGASLSGMGL